MKQCPQCGAEYDNHVQFCFVDSTELSLLRTSAATPAPAIPPRKNRVVPLVVMGVLFVVATPLVVVGMIFAVGFDRGEPNEVIMAEPTPAASTPAPEPAPALVRVESIPPGAAVWEQDTQLCEQTPCSIEQPDYGPAVRELRLVMAGYETQRTRLEKPNRELTVSMQTETRSPAPPRPTTARPPARELPPPEPVRPAEDPEPKPDGLIDRR